MMSTFSHELPAEFREPDAASSTSEARVSESAATVDSPLTRDEALAYLLPLCVRELHGREAWVYLFAEERERLVLACAGELYRPFVGRLEIVLGEGFVGHVGLTRRPALLQGVLADDPHFLALSEDTRADLQTTLALPIIDNERRLLGVIGVHADADTTFDEAQQCWLARMAALVAALIECAVCQRNAHLNSHIMLVLTGISRAIGTDQPLDAMLHDLASLTKDALDADLCLILLLDRARSQLVLRASSPSLNAQALDLTALTFDKQSLDRLYPAGSQHDPLKDSGGRVMHTSPLLANGEFLGQIYCYSDRVRCYTGAEHALFYTIANQIALAVRHSYQAHLPSPDDHIRELLEALMEGPGERYQEELARIAEYDRSQGAHLLLTLEVYLTHAGSIAEAARTIGIHRNTLQQRLERLSAFLPDLERCETWFALQLALRLYQLRERGVALPLLSHL